MSSNSFATELKIIRRIVFIGKTLHWIPYSEIKLLSWILSFPYRRSHIPHPLVVQRHQDRCPRVWVDLHFMPKKYQEHNKQIKFSDFSLCFYWRFYLSCVSGKSINKIVKRFFCRCPLSRTKSNFMRETLAKNLTWVGNCTSGARRRLTQRPRSHIHQDAKTELISHCFETQFQGNHVEMFAQLMLRQLEES